MFVPRATRCKMRQRWERPRGTRFFPRRPCTTSLRDQRHLIHGVFWTSILTFAFTFYVDVHIHIFTFYVLYPRSTPTSKLMLTFKFHVHAYVHVRIFDARVQLSRHQREKASTVQHQ